MTILPNQMPTSQMEMPKEFQANNLTQAFDQSANQQRLNGFVNEKDALPIGPEYNQTFSDPQLGTLEISAEAKLGGGIGEKGANISAGAAYTRTVAPETNFFVEANIDANPRDGVTRSLNAGVKTDPFSDLGPFGRGEAEISTNLLAPDANLTVSASALDQTAYGSVDTNLSMTTNSDGTAFRGDTTLNYADSNDSQTLGVFAGPSGRGFTSNADFEVRDINVGLDVGRGDGPDGDYRTANISASTQLTDEIAVQAGFSNQILEDQGSSQGYQLAANYQVNDKTTVEVGYRSQDYNTIPVAGRPQEQDEGAFINFGKNF